jgi:methylenetetrahydrofolate dehydrogenase (NADP+)/methenyltetrahydrofolate cyclohydrolase
MAMSATIIDGKAIAARVRADVAKEVEAFKQEVGRSPGLATVLVGDDPASAVYVGGKQRACLEVGMTPFDRRLPADASFETVAEELDNLNIDPAVSGILLQLPVPEHLDGPALTAMIGPDKDVDGLTPVNAGLLSLSRPGLRPCTPSGVMELLTQAGASLQGAEAVVVGRSNLFGKPMAQLLLAENATVTICHSRTRDLREVCSRADVLIAAVGRARLIQGDFIKPGAVVIDVGMNRLTPEEAGNKSGLVGDVDYAAASEIASAITPVPGGVGPMTIAFLLRNTLIAARYQAELETLFAELDPEGS